MPLGWEGEKCRLVALDKARHLESTLVWVNDPVLTAWTIMGDFPLGRLAEEEYFDRFAKTPPATPEEIGFAVETLDGRHIGLTGLFRIDWRSRTACTGSLIGVRELWGQGYGTDMIRTRTRYAFGVLGLRVLWSEVMDGNVGSLRALLKNGYRECGRLPEMHWKRGAFRDKIIVALRAEDWLKASQGASK
jgi:RimJ/RimL family protein N-acetyltransferase